MTELRLFIAGTPAPAGSKDVMPLRRNGQIVCNERGNPRMKVMDDAGKTKRGKAWKQVVTTEARRAWRGEPIDGPCVLRLTFLIERPKKHLRSNGELKAWAPTAPIGPPDALKLARAVEDHLTGICYRDDAQIVRGGQAKRYCVRDEQPGVHIYLKALAEAPLYEGSPS